MNLCTVRDVFDHKHQRIEPKLYSTVYYVHEKVKMTEVKVIFNTYLNKKDTFI